MLKSVRNYIIVIFLLCCWTPFIFMTDLFPFMRMGMFAEPIKEDFQSERFELWIYEDFGGGEKHLYDPKLDGTDASVFHYLARNYYYRNDINGFVCKLNIRKHYPGHGAVTFIRYTRSLKSGIEDSSSVTTLIFCPEDNR